MTADEARSVIRSLHVKDGLNWNICIICVKPWPCDPSQDIWTADQLERFEQSANVTRQNR